MLIKQSQQKQPVELIYCANGNRRFAEIAINAGFTYGAQLPGTVYFSPEFVDQDWKKPNKEKYMRALAQYKPKMATVLDWEKKEQLPEVLEWAEEAAVFVETVIIIPKVLGGIVCLPKQIGNKPIRLGYSVPTKFSGTTVPYYEFEDRPVHLLGGSPKKQRYTSVFMSVVSADGNYSQMMATRHNKYFKCNKWLTLKDTIGYIEKDAPYKAFELSCYNIIKMWQNKISLFF